jgi:ATP-binding cassette subfamily B protein
MRGQWHGVRAEESRAQSVVQEVFGALRIVVTFGQEKRELDRFAAGLDGALKMKLRALAKQGLLGTALALSTALGSVAILWIGVREVQAQLLSMGDLLLVIAYVAQLYEPLQQIGTHITGQQQAIASAERGFELLDRRPAVAERATTLPLDRADGDIALRDVRFAYAGGAPVLDGVTLDIPAGSFVGVVGRTGAGKSTLAGLLLRLFDPDAGQVTLDAVDLRDLSLADLRRQFAVVPQDPILFSTTIAENIAYGRPGATEEEIVAAAKAARAHEFIMALPYGYATPVGERGTRLSGGERQRIAIARAFLKDAPVLILDEPTSAIDGETEAAIIESMELLMEGRTTFMIAHRLSTLRRATMILRVGNGTIETVQPGPVPLAVAA